MEIKFIDIHTHLAEGEFDESRDRLAAELKDFIVLNAGENKEENSKILFEGQKYSNFLPCIGLHPNVVSTSGREKSAEEIDYIVTHVNEAFAISEIGLDYRAKEETEKALQRKVFSELLELAELKSKVCIVHSRKSIDDLLRTLPSFKTKIIIHNFEGNQAHYARAAEIGAYVSISTAFMRFKRDNLIRKIALDRLFIETDSPALSPDENMNTPLNIQKILKYVAALRNMKEEDLKLAIFENFKKVFYG
jgi:TatD family hydrolase